MGIEIRAAKLNERPEACHLINLAFDAEGYGPSLADPTESVGYSHMDPHDRAENTRILLLDGEIISMVHVADRHVYACGKTIPIGFIAMVATHPDHRHKGYARQLLRDAEIYMQERGFCYGAAPIGYFHITGMDGGIDEIGWRQDRLENQSQVFLAALSWGVGRGNSTIDFYMDDFDELSNNVLHVVFCKPNGQATEDPDPRLHLPENWPDGMGIMVKFLGSGQGILANVNDTDALTEAMAQYSWCWFDGDTM